MKSRKIKSIKIRNKKNKTKTKKQKQRKSRFFAGGTKKLYAFRNTPSFDNYETLHDMVEGERKIQEEEIVLHNMEEGNLPTNYLLKEQQKKEEEKEKMKRIKNANIPFSAFAQKTEPEKKIDAFHEWKTVQNLKDLNILKKNEQYLKDNPAESLRQQESGHSVTVSAPIDPATGEPFVSHNDPDIRPLNLHGERPEKNDDYGFYAHDFDGGKTKRKRNNRQRKRKTRRSIPSRK